MYMSNIDGNKMKNKNFHSMPLISTSFSDDSFKNNRLALLEHPAVSPYHMSYFEQQFKTNTAIKVNKLKRQAPYK